MDADFAGTLITELNKATRERDDLRAALAAVTAARDTLRAALIDLVEYGPLNTRAGYTCAYCGHAVGYPSLEITHAPECPILQGRAALAAGAAARDGAGA